MRMITFLLNLFSRLGDFVIAHVSMLFEKNIFFILFVLLTVFVGSPQKRSNERVFYLLSVRLFCSLRTVFISSNALSLPVY